MRGSTSKGGSVSPLQSSSTSASSCTRAASRLAGRTGDASASCCRRCRRGSTSAVLVGNELPLSSHRLVSLDSRPSAAMAASSSAGGPHRRPNEVRDEGLRCDNTSRVSCQLLPHS